MNDEDCGTVPQRVAPLGVLLQRLSASGHVGQEYERLRFRLVTYFRMRFAAEAEALADLALDRLAARLDDGTMVQNLAAYALGIARLLMLETAARQLKERDAAFESQRQYDLGNEDPDPHPAGPALRACLKSLAPGQAQLILEYYAEDSGAARIERRQRLAAQSDLSLNALRNRALRIREQLEACMKARLQQTPAHHPPW